MTQSADIQNDSIEKVLSDWRQNLDKNATYTASLLSAPDLFDLERERVFGRAWIYLGHETEIPNVNDYMLRYIVDDQFIITRDREGKVHGLLNSCRHRGMQLCRADRGNSARFTCTYHGWSFNNNGALLAAPMSEDLYPPDFDKSQWGLRKIPRLEIFTGMIFGCLDPEAPPLDQYLGDMKWYLQLLTARTKNGLEVGGPPQRWVIDTDWKIAAENFAGDAYHVGTTHRSILGGLEPRDPKFAMRGHHISAGNGHGLGIGAGPEGAPKVHFSGLPESMWPEVESTLSPAQVTVARDALFIHGTVFPNMSFLTAFEAKDENSRPTAMLTFRVWHPIAPGKMEVWSWFMVDRSATPELKKEIYGAYLRTFGSSGAAEQDDAENWRSIRRATKGQFARSTVLNYQLGHGKLEPDADWPGPGQAYPLAFAELNQRAFHKRWIDYMSRSI